MVRRCLGYNMFAMLLAPNYGAFVFLIIIMNITVSQHGIEIALIYDKPPHIIE